MGSKLLLADDSITIQKVVGIIFANEDYELTVVDNGGDALKKAREIAPDVILVDALMPGMTGYEVCEEIRRDPSLKGTPLLFMTGAFEPFDEEKAAQSGADDYISKPFESQALIDKVRKLIDLGKTRPAPAAVAEALPSVDEMFAEPVLEGVVEADAPVDFFAEDVFEAETLAEPAPLTGEELLEVAPEDDLWGAMELEEMGEEETFAFAEVVEEGEEETEPFAFAEALEPEVFGAAETEADEPLVFAEAEVITEADTFASSVEFASIPADEAGMEEVLGFAEPVDESEDFSFSEEAFVPEQEPLPVSEFIEPAPPLAQAPSAAPGMLTISEADLAAAVSRISREIIERIAWEVVPDLAEAIIKEEIKKIKEGA